MGRYGGSILSGFNRLIVQRQNHMTVTPKQKTRAKKATIQNVNKKKLHASKKKKIDCTESFENNILNI